jgi:hypothetical protein
MARSFEQEKGEIDPKNLEIETVLESAARARATHYESLKQTRRRLLIRESTASLTG